MRASQKIEFGNLEEILPYLDEVRRLSTKLQGLLEYLLLDPFSFEKEETKTEINGYAKAIKDLCISGGIQYEFYKIPKEHSDFSKQYRSSKYFVNYKFDGIEITDLLVFSKRKNKYSNKIDIAEIMDFDTDGTKELDLDFDTPASKEKHLEVLDENGNDLNTIPGLED